MDGGSQQLNLRSGTENVYGIHSIYLALKDVMDIDVNACLEVREVFEKELLSRGSNLGEIVLKESKRVSNTTYFIFNKSDAQTVAMSMDLSGIDVSNGSACSSGAVVASRVLMSLGYTENQSKSAIRFSFPYSVNLEEYSKIKDKLFSVIDRFV